MRNLIFLLVLLTTISCTSRKEKSLADIQSGLKQVNNSFEGNKLDTAAARQTEQAIGEFLKMYPQDTLASQYLFELGMLYQKQRKFEEALNAFDKVYREYPYSRDAGNAVFLQGFLYANVLNDLVRAKEKYQLFLDKYSNVDPKMTNDVKMELENLGKSPEELLKEIQEREHALDDTAMASLD